MTDLATQIEALSAAATPGEWAVREHPQNGDCFVTAPDVNGFAYDAEILGDDEYRKDDGRKRGDCTLIATMCGESARKQIIAAIRAADEVEALRARVAELEDTVRLAARWFEQYAIEHEIKANRASDSGEQMSRTDKAQKNADRAAELRKALEAKP